MNVRKSNQGTEKEGLKEGGVYEVLVEDVGRRAMGWLSLTSTSFMSWSRQGHQAQWSGSKDFGKRGLFRARSGRSAELNPLILSWGPPLSPSSSVR